MDKIKLIDELERSHNLSDKLLYRKIDKIVSNLYQPEGETQGKPTETSEFRELFETIALEKKLLSRRMKFLSLISKEFIPKEIYNSLSKE